MANKTITDLTSGGAALTGDLLPIDRAGSTLHVTAGSIAALAGGGGGGSTYLIPTPGLNLTSSPGGLASVPLGGISVFKFSLSSSVTWSKLAYVSSSGFADTVYAFAIYSADGLTKLLDSGPLTLRNTALAVTLGSPVTLPAGTYLMAYGESATSTTGNCVMGVLPSFAYSGINDIGGALNINSLKMATATNTITRGGVMPATLGTLVAPVSAGFCAPSAIFE